MKRPLIAIVSLVMLTCLHPTQAQDSNAQKAATITAARQQNAALMKQYTWDSRTELIDKGRVVDIHLDLVTYGSGGQLQRTPLNDQSSHKPRGFLRREIAKEKKEEMQEYLTGLRGLLDQYTLLSEGKILDFINQAKMELPGPDGLVLLTGRDVVVPSDQLSLWVSAATHKPQRVQVNTTFQGDSVTMTGTYKTLPSGLNYLEFAEVEIPGKELTLQVHNFNYTRTE
ncbi:MAG TPA: hypothetical protein VHP11_16250 [Tepidisphaeraceae bacterium]|nr:hypothetical protein [Tepidisphaeraceae bacterium]